MSFLIVMALLLVVMYVLMIRPQRRRQQEQQSMIEAAAVGDDILTTGGIYGTVMQAEGDDIVVDLAPGVSVHMTRRGIAAVLPPEAEEESTLDADEAVEELDVDEASDTTAKAAVTTEAGADATAGDRR